jgi:hypothetical protein
MIKRLLLIMWIILAAHSLVFSQGTGSLYGTVKDKGTGETIPFANVAVLSSGVLLTGAQTDFDGKYTIRAINPGTYTLRVSCIGYQTQEIPGLLISTDKTLQYNVLLSTAITTLATAVIEGYKVPPFE